MSKPVWSYRNSNSKDKSLHFADKCFHREQTFAMRISFDSLLRTVLYRNGI